MKDDLSRAAMTSAPLEASTNETVFPRRFGRYVLACQLGEGGMGRVYLAIERSDPAERLCVIKRFGNPRARFTPEQIDENRERFRREAQITMALAHPGIARTFSYSDDGRASYLVQEFIRGVTLDYLLSQLSADEAVPVPLSAHIIFQLAEALHYVHDFRGLGLVHRDLTSSNVMFSRAGEVKVIDFGIAKATLSSEDNTLTKPNILVGKPLWTAPEVLLGMKPDRRADVYALGILFWNLLAGRDPEGQLAAGSQLPSPSAVKPGISRHVDEIVAKATSKSPTDRFQTAREIRDAIAPLIPSAYPGQRELAALLAKYEPVLEERFFQEVLDRARPLLGDDTSPPRPRRKLLLPTLLGAAALVAFGVVAATSRFGIHRTSEQPPLHQVPLPPPPLLRTVPAPTTPPIPSPEPPSPPPQPTTQPSPTPHPRTPTPVPRARSATDRPTASPQRTLRPAADSAALLASAMEATADGDATKALRLARASIEVAPSSAAYILVGKLLSRSDPTAARAALQAAVHLNPEDTQARSLLNLLNRTDVQQ
jgi:serine/threonine protein kinase